ncbi:MAG: anthranilate synthase component I family protein [Acidobacteria bacterium]|nr:anthranilate synthase component I family protein [Acidobacteriota bacterium]
MKLLRRRIPADLITPLSAYLSLRGEGASLLLESCDLGERVGRYSFVLLDPREELRLEGRAEGWPGQLRRLAGPRFSGESLDPASELPLGREAMPVGVGLAGYVGFEALAGLEPSLPLPAGNALGLPCVWAKTFGGALVLDHLHQVAELQLLVGEDGSREGYERLASWAGGLGRCPTPRDGNGAVPEPRALQSREAFEATVKRIQAFILEGDVYQLVPSQRIQVQGAPAPLEAYRRLRRLNPSPYAYLLEWEGLALVGASPEMLVRVNGDEAETLPIAGTVPRGHDEEEDLARFEALKRDPKELAEHQMLVDLARNDLGRIAVPGGVRVEKPLALQRTSHVLHLTTTVKARLKPGLDALDVLASAFPAGTVSGAPKIRAAQRIAEMEGEARGPYGGALLRYGADGILDTALILRTAIYSAGSAFLQAGAGIVRASVPEKEYRETLHKMGAVAEALGVDLGEVCG